MSKVNFLILILICGLCHELSGQAEEEVYLFGEDVKASILRDTTPWKNQTGAVAYSFIGDYQNTLGTWDLNGPRRAYVPTKSDSAFLAASKVVGAREYILERAATESVVIINEAHHHARHRLFTRSLLAGLYAQGYRYLGLEALDDSLVNTRNYAVPESGYYTQEPEFGNLIYEAHRLGFTLFGYEAGPGKNGKEREIEQAQRIQQFMKQHPDGKYVIHCGFDHVFEKEVRQWEKAMAGRLKEFTGIDPLTVDQVKFTEKSMPDYGHYFTYATGTRTPFVLLQKEGVVFNGFSEPRQTDIVVIHPVSGTDGSRPVWQKEGKTAFNIPVKKLKGLPYPVQVLAYRKKEYAVRGIPADILEMNDARAQQPLYLFPGEYVLEFRNRKYEVAETLEVRVP
jgi:hypothetical protein